MGKKKKVKNLIKDKMVRQITISHFSGKSIAEYLTSKDPNLSS
jgi:hypothetical protein